MTTPIAAFEIHDCFKITGRGVVLKGLILHGNFWIEDLLKFELNSQIQEHKIISLDIFRKTEVEALQYTGILIKIQDEKTINDLVNWTPDKTIAKIFRQD